MKKYLYQSLALLAVAFLGSFATWSVVGQSSEARAVPALTYELVVTQFDQDGKAVQAGRETHAIRSNGSRATIASYKDIDGTPIEIRHIDDLVARTQYTINPAVGSISSMPIAADTANWLISRARACAQDATAEKGNVLGYDVVKSTLKPSSGGMAVETWSAPSLGCATLKLTFLHDGKVVSVKLAENIQPGEPAAQLFEIPTGFREMSPSEVARAVRQKAGKVQPPDNALEKIADEAYRKRRSEVGLNPGKG